MGRAYNSTSYLLGLPQINSIDELSNTINLTEQTLYHLSYKSEKFYKLVLKGKKNGTYRELACPSKELKAVQAWILRNILDAIPVNSSATGFRKKCGILDNVQRHKGNTYFLCIDLENFFPSILRKNVYNLFRSLGYNQHISLFFTNICTYQTGLPQGGVTSPSLSNLINIRLDRRISGYASKKNLVFTRYADDITLSSRNPDKLASAYKVLEQIIQDEGYKINPLKTRFLRPGSRREITGLVYSEEQQIGIGRKRKKEIRGKIFDLEFKTFHEEEYEQKLAHIGGWLSFLKGTDPVAYNQLTMFWEKVKRKKTSYEEIYYQEAAATYDYDDEIF
ncbi:retron St85 family RNA-directed DNA polymerase [Paenibacillus glucanolyticus]